jgi:hypothetical protein
LQVFTCRDADGGVLVTEGRYGVVQVICVGNLGDIGSLQHALALKGSVAVLESYPEIVFAIQVDLGASWYSSALVRPWSSYARRTVNGDLASSGEAKVCPVVTSDERGIVCIGTDTTTCHWVAISIDSRDGGKQRDDEVGSHLDWLIPGEMNDRLNHHVDH